jgi:hypothetical protein
MIVTPDLKRYGKREQGLHELNKTYPILLATGQKEKRENVEP